MPLPDPPVEHRRSARTKTGFRIAERLRERIVRGELAPGDPLPVEGALIEQLGVSKSVVREALRILEMEGLVSVRRGVGGGSRVTRPPIVTVSQAVGVHLQLQAVSILDVWTAHCDLVLTAIGRLANEPRPDALNAIDLAVDALEAKVGARSDYSVAVTAVAEEIVRQAANVTQHLLISALSEVIASELASADATVGYAKTDVQERIVRSFRSVVKHLRAGHGKAASRTYKQEADTMAEGLRLLLPGATVVDVFPWRMPGRA